MNEFYEMIQGILLSPMKSFIIILNLILIESILSIDNAAVLAGMVKDLPLNKRKKALKYGIWGAYIFRGLAIFLVNILTKIWFLKVLGGLYLLYITFSWYKSQKTETKEDDIENFDDNWFTKLTSRYIGAFWSTVIMVEIMDLAFSIDNVFAAVAYTDNIILIIIGVFIGILAMRFVANWFIELMEKYPKLEVSAFIVIGLLGFRLFLSFFEHLYPQMPISKLLSSHFFETLFSILSILIFVSPFLITKIYKTND